MKVEIEVPNKFFEIAKGIMLAVAISKDIENDLNQVMDNIYKSDHSLQVKMELLMDGDSDVNQSYSNIMLAIATLTIGQFSRLLKEDKKAKDINDLSEHLES